MNMTPEDMERAKPRYYINSRTGNLQVVPDAAPVSAPNDDSAVIIALAVAAVSGFAVGILGHILWELL